MTKPEILMLSLTPPPTSDPPISRDCCLFLSPLTATWSALVTFHLHCFCSLLPCWSPLGHYHLAPGRFPASS